MQTVWQWLDQEERNLVWLARHTGRTVAAVSRYRSGARKMPDEWVARVEKLAGKKLQRLNGNAEKR